VVEQRSEHIVPVLEERSESGWWPQDSSMNKHGDPVVADALARNSMSDTARYLLFLLITGCLGACFIRVFWEWEQARASDRKGVKADRRRE